jgi:hypothetical protein
MTRKRDLAYYDEKVRNYLRWVELRIIIGAPPTKRMCKDVENCFNQYLKTLKKELKE